MFALLNFCVICSFSNSNYATFHTTTDTQVVSNPIIANKDFSVEGMAYSVIPAPQKMLDAHFHTYDDAITSPPTVIVVSSESITTTEAASTSIKISHISKKTSHISGGRSPMETSNEIKSSKSSTFPLGKKSF